MDCKKIGIQVTALSATACVCLFAGVFVCVCVCVCVCVLFVEISCPSCWTHVLSLSLSSQTTLRLLPTRQLLGMDVFMDVVIIIIIKVMIKNNNHN